MARLNEISSPINQYSNAVTTQTSRPLVTGSGILKSRRIPILLFSQLPRARTRIARLNVVKLSSCMGFSLTGGCFCDFEFADLLRVRVAPIKCAGRDNEFPHRSIQVFNCGSYPRS